MIAAPLGLAPPAVPLEKSFAVPVDPFHQMRENSVKNREKLIETEAEIRCNKKLIAEKERMLAEAKAIQASLKNVLENVDAVQA